MGRSCFQLPRTDLALLQPCRSPLSSIPVKCFYDFFSRRNSLPSVLMNARPRVAPMSKHYYSVTRLAQDCNVESRIGTFQHHESPWSLSCCDRPGAGVTRSPFVPIAFGLTIFAEMFSLRCKPQSPARLCKGMNWLWCRKKELFDQSAILPSSRPDCGAPCCTYS